MIRNRTVAKAAMVKKMAYYFAELGKIPTVEEIHKMELHGLKTRPPFSLKNIKQTIGSYSMLVTMAKREYSPLLNSTKSNPDPLAQLRASSTEK